MNTLADTDMIAADRVEPFRPSAEHPTDAQLRGRGDLCFLALGEARYANLSVKACR